MAVAALLAACATEPRDMSQYFADIDVTAGPGEPRSLDSICEVEEAAVGSQAVVRVLCPMEPIVDHELRAASLEQGFGFNVFPEPLNSGFTVDNRWVTNFLIDDGATMFRVPPEYPQAALAPLQTANCVLRYDLTPDGATTGICVACAATGEQAAFEEAAVNAVSRWIYPSTTESRADIRTTLAFALEDPNAPVAPPASTDACPIQETDS